MLLRKKRFPLVSLEFSVLYLSSVVVWLQVIFLGIVSWAHSSSWIPAIYSPLANSQLQTVMSLFLCIFLKIPSSVHKMWKCSNHCQRLFRWIRMALLAVFVCQSVHFCWSLTCWTCLTGVCHYCVRWPAILFSSQTWAVRISQVVAVKMWQTEVKSKTHVRGSLTGWSSLLSPYCILTVISFLQLTCKVVAGCVRSYCKRNHCHFCLFTKKEMTQLVLWNMNVV